MFNFYVLQHQKNEFMMVLNCVQHLLIALVGVFQLFRKQFTTVITFPLYIISTHMWSHNCLFAICTGEAIATIVPVIDLTGSIVENK